MQNVTNQSGGLSVGDRLQNFMRFDQAGKPRVIYEDYCARALVLLVAAGKAAPTQLKALGQAQWPRGSQPLALICGDPEAAKGVAEANGLELPVLADDGGIVQYLLGQMPTEPSLLLFDHNDRLVARAEASQVKGTLADWALQALSEQSRSDDRVIRSIAPVLAIPRVFDDPFCQELMDYFEQAGSYEAGVYAMREGQLVFTPEPEVKIRRDHTIEDLNLTRRIQALLVRRVIPEIEWAFGFKVTRFEQFKLIKYSADTGGYFRPHRDNSAPDTAHRRFAMTLNLNTGDYQGGELRFPEYGNERYQAAKGGAVVFSCNLAHEALDVTHGSRYALLSFFFGEQEELQRQANAANLQQAVVDKKTS